MGVLCENIGHLQTFLHTNLNFFYNNLSYILTETYQLKTIILNYKLILYLSETCLSINVLANTVIIHVHNCQMYTVNENKTPNDFTILSGHTIPNNLTTPELQTFVTWQSLAILQYLAILNLRPFYSPLGNINTQ